MKYIILFSLSLFVSVAFAQQSTDSDILRRAEVMPIFQECKEERFANSPYPCTLFHLGNHFKNAITTENPSGQVTKCVLYLVVEVDGSVSNVSLVRGVVVNAVDTQTKTALEQSLNARILEEAQQLTFQSPGYQNGQKARVALQFSANVNY